MKRELMITAYERHLCACYYEDEKLTELNLLPSKEHAERTVLGNIYVGRNTAGCELLLFLKGEPAFVFKSKVEFEAGDRR